MDYFSEWVLLVFVFSFAVMSPGPDFVIAVRNAIVFSRKVGLFTAFGFALGVCVHVFYSIVGLGALIAQSVLLFNVIKIIGAGYLIYIGFKALRSKGAGPNILQNDSFIQGSASMSSIQAVMSGFITNVFNPKAILFFLALFTQILDPETPTSVQILFGGTCAVMVWVWFSFVALVLTHHRVRAVFFCASRWIDRICGGLMIVLGVKLALSR